MKKNLLFAAMAVMLGFAFVLAACGSQPSGMAAAPASSSSISLNEAIAQAAAQMEARLPAQTVPVDQVFIAWLRTMDEKTHKTPTEIIGELVRKKISAS